MITYGELQFYMPLDQKTIDKLKAQERIDIEDMEFSVGTFNGLRKMNIRYLDELLLCSLAKLRNRVGIGVRRSEEIRRRVSELGYEMKE